MPWLGRRGAAMRCGICGGPVFLLGKLGSRTHYRCRMCGMDASSDGREPDYEDDDEDGAVECAGTFAELGGPRAERRESHPDMEDFLW